MSGGRRRRLAYVLKRFPRISETFVAAELIELERNGEQVTVFAVSRPQEAFTHGFLEELKAEVVYLPYRPLRQPLRVIRALARTIARDRGRWFRAAAAGLRRPSLSSWRLVLQATVLRDEMLQAGIDHAHAHFATSAADLAHLAWRMGGPSYSVTAHAKDIYHEQVRHDDLRRKLGGALFVATVSEGNRSYLDGILNGNARVRVVPNSVDIRRLGEPPERHPEAGLVVTVARLVEKKGLPDLVDACGLLAQRGVPVRLEVAGDGPLRAELEAKAAASGLDAVFHGALPHEQVRSLYERATAFCLPCVVAATGDRDGLPTSVLESMALGVPVVTTGVNGLEETVIDGVTGLIVPEHDPAALSGALERLLGDPELAARLAAQGRRHVEDGFTLERSVSILRSLFPETAVR
jgi:glycosyltransferase involved in cell wall biosynthesis